LSVGRRKEEKERGEGKRRRKEEKERGEGKRRRKEEKKRGGETGLCQLPAAREGGGG
jgi:hypothetical protein